MAGSAPLRCRRHQTKSGRSHSIFAAIALPAARVARRSREEKRKRDYTIIDSYVAALCRLVGNGE